MVGLYGRQYKDRGSETCPPGRGWRDPNPVGGESVVVSDSQRGIRTSVWWGVGSEGDRRGETPSRWSTGSGVSGWGGLKIYSGNRLLNRRVTKDSGDPVEV